MHIKCLIYVVAMAASLSAAKAQVQTSPLALNEVLLQVHAKGKVQSPAQVVSLLVYLQTSGPTTAAARSANTELFDKVIAALKKAGGDPNRVRILGPTRSMGFVGNEAYGVDLEGASMVALADRVNPEPQSKALVKVGNQIEVQFTDFALIEIIRDSMEAAGAKVAAAPVFSLADDVACKRQARTEAISKAQEMARSYAEALGLSVIRIVRISDQGSGVDGPASVEEIMQQMSGANSTPVGQVETTSYVWVDFAIGPKQR
jgi:uncharacterized protein